MNSIKDLLPGSMRERTFQLKARRDAGAVWNDPQFVECKKCGRRATRQIWNKAQYVCPNCGVHLPIGGYYRLSLVLDKGSFRELDADLAPQDVLQFPGYPEKLEAQTGKTGLKEAVITATGRIEGTPVVAAVLDSRFFMGSMSTTVGEKITRAVEHATAKHLPLVIFSASGGARMQEGILSLMQMAKTSAALARFAEKGLLYISVLTDPTTGGVTAAEAASASALVTRPPRPLPATSAAATPFSSSILRAAGMATPAAGFAAGATSGLAAAAAFGFSAGAVAATVATASVSMRAITSPATTVSPFLLTNSTSTPDAGAGNSRTTLSVSMSIRFSSRETAAPTSLCQETSVASATDSDSCGTLTSMIMLTPD